MNDATARFAALVRRPDPEVPLDEAALVIAAHAHPDLDVPARLDQLDGLAAGVRPRTADGAAAALFGPGGFTGNTDDYYDPDNSYLDAVLDRRVGIPITLSVVMIEVARRVGVKLHGVGMPGHFLVGARDAGEPVFYDAFHGGARLDASGCASLFARLQGGDAGAFRAEFLAPVATRTILDRILANLQQTLLTRAPAQAAWPVRLRLTLPGVPAPVRSELAAVLGSLGRFGEAAAVLEALAAELGGDAAADAASAAARLRSRAN